MRRRDLLVLLGSTGVLWPLVAQAQSSANVHRIGYLGINIAAGDPHNRQVFLQTLRDLGYTEGHNLLIEYRDAEGKPERFPTLAAELVALNVDVIVAAGGTLGALAAKQATTTLPIVFTAVGDPVADGLVTSLARPGGNITGHSVVTPELIGKMLQLLQQAVPAVSRVALLLKPDVAPEPTMLGLRKEASASARALGVQLQIVEARGPEDFERAFGEITERRADALAVLVTPAFYSGQQRLARLATENRLPTVFSDKDFAVAGGLISYGPNFPSLHRRAANYVDKILKGAKAGDLPVEQPTEFDLVINLKTADALGLTVSPSLLSLATEIIE